METAFDTPLPIERSARTFIEVAEIWVPENGRLVMSSGAYGTLDGFADVSSAESFAKGEGLPGRAWAEARPVVLTQFDGTGFKRTEAAREAGLTSAVAVPLFAGATLKAVLVVLCADSDGRTGAIEVWAETDGILCLDNGYYGAAVQFGEVSRRTSFARGQGLPGGVWSSRTPMLLRDLGSGHGFVRGESAGAAGLTTGLGLPVPVPGGKNYVLTLLSAPGTPLARRFEIWDARAARVGHERAAKLVDGICDREGPLWDPENAGRERRVNAWQGTVGQVLGTGLPVVESGTDAAGYASMVALPIHRGGELAHIVAWYF